MGPTIGHSTPGQSSAVIQTSSGAEAGGRGGTQTVDSVTHVPSALTRIAEGFGIDRLLLEGGGMLNGTFLANGLIDATSTLILPVIDGNSGAPAIYEQGAGPAQSLELVQAETLENGIVWLRHSVSRES